MANPTPADHTKSSAPIPFRDWTRPRLHLPAPLSSFVGREHEVAAVVDLLRADVRLVTLTGPGGVGKTRLAQAVAVAAADGFPDGVGFVSLAPIADPALVAPTVARALEIREAGDAPLLEQLAAALRDERLLLVLDNFEHVVDAAPFVADLLAACPHLTILVTSRVRLRISGERVHAVPPLALPAPGRTPTRERVSESAAVRLFTERAQAVSEDFALTEATAATVVAICRRLDGLPLAIELAAAWSRLLSPPALLARLERRPPLLTGGGRDLPDRHRTMRETIAWSHDLLTGEEQALFRRLAVFVGGFDPDAAAAVAGDLNGGVLDGIAALVDQSLVRREADTDDEPRFGMLETVREYGLEQLTGGAEEAATRDRHAAYFLALAERAEPASWGAPEQTGWLDRLDAELANLRAALIWLEEADHAESGLRLAAALCWYWVFRSHRAEGRAWLERALARGGATTAVRAKALYGLGLLDASLGDERAATLLGESLELWRDLGDARWAARALLDLGMVEMVLGHHDRAAPLLEEAAARFAALDDLVGVAFSRMALAVAALERGETRQAEALLPEALALFRRVGYPYGVASTLIGLGWAAEDRGDTAAAAHYAESLTLWDEVGTQEGLADVLAGAGRLAAASGQAEPAARLLGAAAALSESLGYLAPPSERARSERAAATVHAALGKRNLGAAWATGRALAPEQAAAEAATLLTGLAASADARPPVEPATRAGLTPRELEVLRLLAAGRSDRAIAAALFVAPYTASTHVRNILAKLGAASRTEAAAYAFRHGLAEPAPTEE